MMRGCSGSRLLGQTAGPNRTRCGLSQWDKRWFATLDLAAFCLTCLVFAAAVRASGGWAGSCRSLRLMRLSVTRRKRPLQSLRIYSCDRSPMLQAHKKKLAFAASAAAIRFLLAGADKVTAETVRNFVLWRLFLRQWEAFLEHDSELAFNRMPFAH